VYIQLKLCNKGLFADMSKMEHIHEPAILYNLSRRFLQKHQFYTYIGRNVLVSVNPLSWKYPAAAMGDYFAAGDKAADMPHPFVLAGKLTKKE
jgi:myosin heavy subunit